MKPIESKRGGQIPATLSVGERCAEKIDLYLVEIGVVRTSSIGTREREKIAAIINQTIEEYGYRISDKKAE